MKIKLFEDLQKEAWLRIQRTRKAALLAMCRRVVQNYSFARVQYDTPSNENKTYNIPDFHTVTLELHYCHDAAQVSPFYNNPLDARSLYPPITREDGLRCYEHVRQTSDLVLRFSISPMVDDMEAERETSIECSWNADGYLLKGPSSLHCRLTKIFKEEVRNENMRNTAYMQSILNDHLAALELGEDYFSEVEDNE